MTEHGNRLGGRVASRFTPPLRVAVIHMDHWGGAGNSLWARRIAAALRRSGRFEVKLGTADTQDTLLYEQALLVAGIKAQPLPPTSIRERYNDWASALRQELETLWIEHGRLSASAERLIFELPFAREIERFDFVICTKGLLTQIALRLARRNKVQEGATRVVNFVTNPGLLDLAIHRPWPGVLHVISDPSWISALTLQGYPRESIRCCALPESTTAKDLQAGHIPPLLSGFDAARPIVILIANQEGERWLTLIRYVMERVPQAQLIFISINDEELLRDAASLLEQYLSRPTRVTSLLGPADRDAVLTALERFDAPVVITKPGPSTVATIGRFSVPMVLWDAGLPMEDWVLRSARLSGIHFAGSSTEEVFLFVEKAIRNGNVRKPWQPTFRDHAPAVTQIGIDEILLQTSEIEL